MNFGTSAGDAILLIQLAWKTLQGARQACGEHDELTREVASLHKVLQRLQREYENPESLLARADDDRRQEIRELCSGCKHVLKVLDSIITKYNALPEEKRSGRRLWQKIRFGNGEMQDLAQIRLKLSAHTSAILLSVNLCSLGSQGRVEKRLNDVGGDLEGIRGKVNWIAANMSAKSGDGSIWTSYANDDKAFWRELRRGLVQEGYRSSVLHRHKHLIRQYVEELGNRGLFDESVGAEAEAPQEVGGEELSPVDSISFENDDEDTLSDGAKLKVRQPNLESDSGEDERIKKGEPQKARLDFQRKVDSEIFGPSDDAGSTVSLPEDADFLDSQLSPPQDPKPSKYPRSDKQNKSGVLNPQAQEARAPEEQEAHEKRKQSRMARKARTPEQQAAHEKRKEEKRTNGKASAVHTEPQSSLGDRSVSELSLRKHAQVEEITDEEFSATGRADNIDEFGPVLDIHADFEHPMTNPQGSTPDSTSSENFNPPKDRTDDANRLTDSSVSENIASLQAEKKSDVQIEMHVEDGHNVNVLQISPKCETITFQDAVARKFTFPLHRVKTWKEFKYTLDLAFELIDGLDYDVREERYDIVGPSGEYILPQIWEDLIKPGWHVNMHMWPRPENSSEEVRKEHPPLTKVSLLEDDETFESDNQVINFKDAVGRRFTFPYYKVRTWKGMSALIKQAFMFVEMIGPMVEKGHYDLLGPGGMIIIPEFWKDLIQPGWNISMHMWPLPGPWPPPPPARNVTRSKTNIEAQTRDGPGGPARRHRGGGPAPQPGPRVSGPPHPPIWTRPPLPSPILVGNQSERPPGPAPFFPPPDPVRFQKKPSSDQSQRKTSSNPRPNNTVPAQAPVVAGHPEIVIPTSSSSSSSFPSSSSRVESKASVDIDAAIAKRMREESEALVNIGALLYKREKEKEKEMEREKEREEREKERKRRERRKH